MFRQDVPAGSQQQQQQQEGRGAEPQQHELLVWPECSPCDDPLMQHALQLAEPVNKLPLQLDVLPSNMPAELLMTFQGEVSKASKGRTAVFPSSGRCLQVVVMHASCCC